jgi:hypothetical protein
VRSGPAAAAAAGGGVSGRRITLPDGAQGEIIREVFSPAGRILELAYRRLPDGEEQRVYFDHASSPASTGEVRAADGNE